MKKKFLWIATLFAALALLVTGCPTGGGGEEEGDGDDVSATGVYFGKDGGDKIQDVNQPLTLTEDYVRIMFDAPGKDFQKIRVKFSLDQPFGVMQQCAFENDGEKGYTWGGTEDPDMFLDYADVFTYERDPVTAFTSNWSSKAGTFDKKQMVGICFALENGTGIKFTLNEITFVGVGQGSEPPPPPPGPSGTTTVEFKNGVKKTATLDASNFAKADETGKITVTWNPNDENGAFRVKVQFAADSQVDLSSGYSKFKMDWTSGSADGGNFNISLYFSGNRMLSAYGASGTATFDFISDHPSWAAGWGDAAVGIITGFEIFSDDSTNFGSGTLVITKLSFE
ncbi:MAG: hypothetical protein LBC52_01625 [Treponema sp.]|nr:hypothetical protein [Treponema sp.]